MGKEPDVLRAYAGFLKEGSTSVCAAAIKALTESLKCSSATTTAKTAAIGASSAWALFLGSLLLLLLVLGCVLIFASIRLQLTSLEDVLGRFVGGADARPGVSSAAGASSAAGVFLNSLVVGNMAHR